MLRLVRGSPTVKTRDQADISCCKPSLDVDSRTTPCVVLLLMTANRLGPVRLFEVLHFLMRQCLTPNT
jgi:hypothetical protein